VKKLLWEEEKGRFCSMEDSPEEEGRRVKGKVRLLGTQRGRGGKERTQKDLEREKGIKGGARGTTPPRIRLAVEGEKRRSDCLSPSHTKKGRGRTKAVG